MTLRKRISRAGMPEAGLVPRTSDPAGSMASSKPQHGRDGRGGAIERPRQPAEGDHAGHHGGGRECHHPIEWQRAVGRGARQRPEHHDVRGKHQHQAPDHRPLAEAAWPASCSSNSRRRRARKRSTVQSRKPEEPELLGRGWLDRQAVGVVGVALGLADFLGIAVAPDAALAQQPVRGQPAAGKQQRRPPRDSPRARRPRRDPRPSPPGPRQ